jgi:hypothetical protein
VEALNVASTLVDGMCFSALHKEFPATWLGYTLGVMVEILLILLSYVLGSVPTGVLAGRAWLARRRPVGSKGRPLPRPYSPTFGEGVFSEVGGAASLRYVERQKKP